MGEIKSISERPGSNGGVSGDELRGYLDAVAKEDDDLLTLKSEYMLQCKGPRRRIKDQMVLAKQAGINMVALRQLIADDRARRRRDSKIAEMEADDAADLKSMQEALGEFIDTPLGQAALRRE